MYRVASALLLAAASIAPAQAATTVFLSSPAGSTAIPDAINAPVIQDFGTGRPNNSPFVPSTNVVTQGSPVVYSDSATAGAVRPGGAAGYTVTYSNLALAGLTSNHISIGRGATYAISFLTTPVTFFSFAFNITNPGNGLVSLSPADRLVLTYADNTQQTFFGPEIFGFAAGTPNSAIPGFGRANYDTGSGLVKIASVAITSASGRIRIDDIAAAVPEPATWLMMILGFGLVGSQLRRRKVTVKYAAA